MIRDPIIPPAATDALQQTISLYHPAYPKISPLLLFLASDDGGLDYQTALVACCIVAGNCPLEEAWFSQANGVNQAVGKREYIPIDVPEDGILRGGDFFFHIKTDDPEYKYHLVPSFDHWRFPHGKLPASWVDASSTIDQTTRPITMTVPRDTIMARDQTCRVSGYFNETDCAHIVPQASSAWFQANMMNRYVLNPLSAIHIDDSRNGLLLRRDIHGLFDKRLLVIVPKRERLVLHMLGSISGGAAELLTLYHNRCTQPLAGVAIEFLFARFAWAIFCDEYLPIFRMEAQQHSLLLYDPVTSCCFRRDGVSSHDVAALANILPSGSKSRSVSPQKRQRSHDSRRDRNSSGSGSGNSPDRQQWLPWLDGLDDGSNNGTGHGDRTDFFMDIPARGRRRKRSYSIDDNSQAVDSIIAPSLSFTSAVADQELDTVATPGQDSNITTTARKRPRNRTEEKLDTEINHRYEIRENPA